VKIARIFPTRTSYSPDDEHAYFGSPNLYTANDYDEAHISVVFTWDIERGEFLAKDWKRNAKVVKLGGPAINGESKEPFVAGMYLKKGYTITSRGCPNSCDFCLVNKKNLIEFENFPAGNIICDNNILACSDSHWNRVMSMLKDQRKIEFKGGLESRRVTESRANDLRQLDIEQLWLACDSDASIDPLRKAVGILKKAGFKDHHLYCYVLIGKEELRLREVRSMGVMPFAQLYQKPERHKTNYTQEMRAYQRIMSRPAITRSIFNQEKEAL
jgi:hypothetical protein